MFDFPLEKLCASAVFQKISILQMARYLFTSFTMIRIYWHTAFRERRLNGFISYQQTEKRTCSHSC